MNFDESPAGLATLYADIGRRLHPYGTETVALAAVASAAHATVPGTEWASITRGRNGALQTLAATDPRAEVVDGIQYELGTGPCVDAILEETTFRTDDVAADTRWPEFGRRAAATAGVHSMLSFRLVLEDTDYIAGLNLYSTKPAAFDSSSELVGTLVATHGGIAVTASIARERAEGLQLAVMSNRDIGVAMGIIMTTHKVTRDQAFDLLRVASQNSNRKLTEIATGVADTGTLQLPQTRPTRRGRVNHEPRTPPPPPARPEPGTRPEPRGRPNYRPGRD